VIHAESFTLTKENININVGIDGIPNNYLYGYPPIWNMPTRLPSYLYSYPYYYYYPRIYNYYGYNYSPYWSQWRRW
jgi:hypothetical protein